MKITRDNFVWLLVTDKAKEVFSSGLFEVYALHDDESESLIETMDDLNNHLNEGLNIGIEVGSLSDEVEVAKQVLKDKGYYVGNLWRFEDITSQYDCTDVEAEGVLDNVFLNEATVDQIRFNIRLECEEGHYQEFIKLWSISGYYKDDQSEFSDYLVHEYDDCPDEIDDDDIFFFGLSESDIKENIKDGENTGLEFVITSYEPYKYFV